MHSQEIYIKIKPYKRGTGQGGEPVGDTILFGKYELIRTLGRGRCSTVYLAKHLELDEYRAVKCVSKMDTDYERFKKEALILKRLRHPGIPIVYDLEEEAFQSYLIEEFLEGDSFYDLIREKGHLNQDTVIRYGIQICDLVQYLHSAEQIPILYLDLQPKNLLVCHEQVKLLDFDHADFLDGANREPMRFGTPGYAAPEQSGDMELGVYTDVYQIGALLFWLLTGETMERGDIRKVPGELGRILRTCTRENREKRYGSVHLIQEDLKRLDTRTNGLRTEEGTSLICAFAGTRPGMGVTHLALGFCGWLRSRGYEALYEERNHSGDIREMAEFLNKEMDSSGICRLFGIPAKPLYGRAARLEPCHYPVIVRDYGSEWQTQETEMAETVLFLTAGGKWWHNGDVKKSLARMENVRRNGNGTSIVILYTHTVPKAVAQEAREIQALLVPEFTDPFVRTAQIDDFYEQLWKMAGELWEKSGKCLPERKTGKLRRRIRGLLGSLARDGMWESRI